MVIDHWQCGALIVAGMAVRGVKRVDNDLEIEQGGD
jgi:hypothetical protein